MANPTRLKLRLMAVLLAGSQAWLLISFKNEVMGSVQDKVHIMFRSAFGRSIKTQS